MKAHEIAAKASEIIGGDRQATHGDKVENHENIARVWSAIVFRKLKEPFTALDVANLMEGLKIARRYAGKHNLDDYIDGAGYSAVAGEIASVLEEENIKSTHDEREGTAGRVFGVVSTPAIVASKGGVAAESQTVSLDNDPE